MTKGALEMGNEEYIIQWDDMTPEAKAKKERLEQEGVLAQLLHGLLVVVPHALHMARDVHHVAAPAAVRQVRADTEYRAAAHRAGLYRGGGGVRVLFRTALQALS